MSEKKPVSLVVTDIDNTIADKFDGWGVALDNALNSLAKLHGRTREDIENDIQQSTKGKTLYVGRDIREDIGFTPSLHPADPEKAALIEKEHEKIFHEWDKVKGDAKPYDGVFATFNKIKASGAKVVIYTDSRVTPALYRLAKMGVTADMIDGVYAQPDDKHFPIPVKSKTQELKDALGDKVHAFDLKTPKPNPTNMQQILKDMNITDPKTAVMVGDNVNADGGGAIATGMNYAWQKGGTVLGPTAMKCYDRFFKGSSYRLTTEDHLSQMNDSNRPTVILNDFKELSKHFRFVSNEKLNEEKKQTQQNYTVKASVLKTLGNKGR